MFSFLYWHICQLLLVVSVNLANREEEQQSAWTAGEKFVPATRAVSGN